MRKLYVSKNAIERNGIEFFKELKCYDIKYGHFNSFDIIGYDKGNKFAGIGIVKNDRLYFYDNTRCEEVVFVKEI